jgi:GAF domain-containing protein
MSHGAPGEPRDLPGAVGRLAASGDWTAALERVLAHYGAASGTVHWLEADGALHLAAHVRIPPPVLERIGVIPVGRGMAGLAVERAAPVSTCNLQTDRSGDVRPGARATGLGGSLCVPILDGQRAVGALGIGQQDERSYGEAETALLLEVGRALAAQRGSPGPR